MRKSNSFLKDCYVKAESVGLKLRRGKKTDTFPFFVDLAPGCSIAFTSLKGVKMYLNSPAWRGNKKAAV